MGRVFDIGDTLTEFNRSETGEAADYLALCADWRLIGEDVQAAIQKHLQSSGKGTAVVQEEKEAVPTAG